jgi:hypothetical protein
LSANYCVATIYRALPNGDVKVAPTLRACVMLTTQVLAVPLQAPDQPAKLAKGSAAAVSVTLVPFANTALQVDPHEIPGGLLETVPVPEPLLVTVSTRAA